MKIYIIKTTFNNLNDAEKLKDYLLNHNLASCIQISNIKSSYLWEEKICSDDEIQLSIKTKKKKVKQIKSIITNTHTYQIPQIIILKAKASKKYLQWHKKQIK